MYAMLCLPTQSLSMIVINYDLLFSITTTTSNCYYLLTMIYSLNMIISAGRMQK